MSQELRSVWNGLKLHPWLWESVRQPRALLYLSHGVGEYMGRYEQLGQLLASHDVITFGHDHIGHGKSEGDRTHVNSYDTYVNDVVQHVEAMKSNHPQLPCLLMGHSMGGLVALCVALERPDLFTALILSAPSVEINAGLFLQLIARLISFIAPQFGIKSVDPNDISSIPEEVQKYMDDPLIYHEPLKANWGAETVKTIKLVRSRIREVTLPVLIIHGTDDMLVPFSASQFVRENIGSSDKTFKSFEGSRHEILHDRDQQNAMELIRDWILSHLTTPPEQVSTAVQPVQQEPHQEVQDEEDTSVNEQELGKQKQVSTAVQPVQQEPRQEVQDEEDTSVNEQELGTQKQQEPRQEVQDEEDTSVNEQEFGTQNK